jgi:hypothetical protein
MPERLDAIFKRNDIESLFRLSVRPAFDISQKIALSIVEPCFFVSNSPSIIEFAGFCGAIDCFEFFPENGAHIALTDNNSVLHGDVVAAFVRPCHQEVQRSEARLSDTIEKFIDTIPL